MIMPLLWSAVLPLAAAFQPPYPPAIAASVQPWGITTLKEQVRAHHVAKVAFHSDASAIEVLDINGLQRRVDLFPAAVPGVIDELHREHVEFFVAPAPNTDAFVPRLVRSVLCTMVVIWVIDLLGFMPDLLFGATVIGAGLFRLSDMLNQFIDEAGAGGKAEVGDAFARHNAAVEALFGGGARAEEASEALPDAPPAAGASAAASPQPVALKVMIDEAWQAKQQQQQQQQQHGAVPVLVEEEENEFDV